MIDAVTQDLRLPAGSRYSPRPYYLLRSSLFGRRIGFLVAGTRVMNGNDTVSREKEGQR